MLQITGIYFVAVGLVFLVYREQSLAAKDESSPFGWYSWLTSSGLIIFASLGFAFLRGRLPVMNAVHFALPLAGLAMLLIIKNGASAAAHRESDSDGCSACWLHSASVSGCPSWGMLRSTLPMARLATFTKAWWCCLVCVSRAVPFRSPGLRVLLSLGPWLPCWPRDFNPWGHLNDVGISALVGMIHLLCSSTQVGFAIGFSLLRNVTPMIVAIALWMLIHAERFKLSNEDGQLLF